MKANVLDINGNKLKEINLPNSFSEKIRKDIVEMILWIKRVKQPYSPSLVAGKQHSASGKIRHRRHVWQTHYGRGMSRIPRKVMSRRGSQFNWEGAEISSARGGRRAHPPRVLSMIKKRKVNKKELNIALNCVLSASANKKFVVKRYGKMDKKNLRELPIIVESKFTELKTKEILKLLKKILGENLFRIVVKNKSIRAGKGKLRGRKYKSNSGILFVVGEKERLKTNIFDVANIKNLSINDLAKGGLGRLVVYTEEAIKNLENKFGEEK